MIYMLEGFDLHTPVVGGAIPGQPDYWNYIYTPPLNQLLYDEGAVTGRCAVNYMLSEYGISFSGAGENRPPVGATTFRVHWWGKQGFQNRPWDAEDSACYCHIAGFDTGDPDFLTVNTGVGVAVSSDGHARLQVGDLRHAGGADVFEVITDWTPFPVVGPVWTYYEMWVDMLTGEIRFWVNGILTLEGVANTNLTPTTRAWLFFNHPQNWVSYFDHIILTDGESLQGTPGRFRAPSVTPAWDRFEARTVTGIKGNLVIDGASYTTLPVIGTLTSNFSWADKGMASVINFFYDKNPATGAAWSSLSEIDSWGICTHNFPIEPDGRRGQLRAMGLTIVTTNEDGFPILKVQPPTGLTYFSGHWTRSNDALTLSAHINDVNPRHRVGESLFIDNLGCVLFTANPDAPRPFGKIGITFAEEYRTSYTDWESVYGEGIPYTSYFITGYSILGDANKDFQSNYVTVNYEVLTVDNIPVGGAYLQGVWDYALDGDTGRWGTRQQVYRFNGNYKNQMVKLKVRGHGKSLQIKITSEQNKDFRINGWSTYVTANSNV